MPYQAKKSTTLDSFEQELSNEKPMLVPIFVTHEIGATVDVADGLRQIGRDLSNHKLAEGHGEHYFTLDGVKYTVTAEKVQ